MTHIEALQLIATPQRPDGTWNRDREACRKIAADALASTTDPTAALKLARDALAFYAAADCWRAQDAIAAIDALPAPSGEPVAEIDREGVLWLNTNPHRLPIGTKLYAGATAQAAPAPQASGEPAAWMHEDGRVIPANTMDQARKDGGASLSSVRGYTIPLVRSPAPRAAPAPLPAGISKLDPNEEDPGRLWAEIARLCAALKGPDGYATWQDAATAERIRRVRAERKLAAQAAPAPLSEALARLLPTLEAAMRGLVFTADKAGQVAADMNTLRAAAGITATTAKEPGHE